MFRMAACILRAGKSRQGKKGELLQLMWVAEAAGIAAAPASVKALRACSAALRPCG